MHDRSTVLTVLIDGHIGEVYSSHSVNRVTLISRSQENDNLLSYSLLKKCRANIPERTAIHLSTGGLQMRGGQLVAVVDRLGLP